MFRTISAVVAATATVCVGLVALTAPPAAADAPTFDCRLRAVSYAPVTGRRWFEGVLVGFVAHEPSPVSIACRVTVNDIVRDGTSPGAGVGYAYTGGTVRFPAGEYDVVKVCAYYTSTHGSGTSCNVVQIVEVPPQVVYDTVDAAYPVRPIVDPPLCAALQSLQGTWGGPPLHVDINSQGDVWVNGMPVYDCPPYDLDMSPSPITVESIYLASG